MSHSGLSISTDQRDGATVVSARGSLDLSTRLKLSTVLNDAITDGGGPVVVDLCDVPFMDSTGLGALMNALRRLARQDRTLRVVCPPGAVRRVFELTGLEGTFELHDSRDGALP